jgi:hypothetical protein
MLGMTALGGLDRMTSLEDLEAAASSAAETTAGKTAAS